MLLSLMYLMNLQGFANSILSVEFNRLREIYHRSIYDVRIILYTYRTSHCLNCEVEHHNKKTVLARICKTTSI